MKSIYDKRSLQTAESQRFSIEIAKAIQPILKSYFEKGFSIKDLSHEAQSVVKNYESDYMMSIHM